MVTKKESKRSGKGDNAEVRPIEVSYDASNCYTGGKIDSILSKLTSSEAVIGVDNEIVESLIPELEGAEINAHTLVLCNFDESNSIMDKDGSIFNELVTALQEASALETLVFVGHSFGSLVLPAAFPESVKELVFDNCAIRSLDFEESAANDLETLVLSKVSKLQKLAFPEHGVRNLQRLKVTRLPELASLELEAEAIENGEQLEVTNCKSLESVTLGASSFAHGLSLAVSKNVSLTTVTLGEKCFERAAAWELGLPELRVLELQGGNFTKLAEVDLTALASLQTLQVGAGALSGATSLICENMRKLKELELGDGSFEGGERLFLSEMESLRVLALGARCFRSLTECVLNDMPRLETLEVGEQSLTKLRRLVLLKNQCLKSVKIGKGALKRCEYFVLLNYLNRVHLDDQPDHLVFIPEEYPGLPQEADVNCKQYSVCVEGCSRLVSLEFGVGCLAAIKHVDISYLKRLKTLSLQPGQFEEAETLSITDNAKITDIVIPEGCFQRVQYFNLQDIPNLVTLDIDSNVMAEGGFCVMRNLYPTTISVSKNSLLCTASSYKSIPKKLQRICVKNLSNFQKRIASDAFLGQMLVGSISTLSVIAIVVVCLL